MAADKPEADKSGRQQAWGQNTYKLLSGTVEVLLLYVDNISRGGTDRNKAEAAEPHKQVAQEPRTSLAGVRKDLEEAYMLRRTMARPQQRRSPEKQRRQWGNLDPTPYSPEKPKSGAPSKSTLFCSEHIGAVTIQDEQTRVKDFYYELLNFFSKS